MNSILTYCLANLPKSYDTTYPIRRLARGERGVLELVVLRRVKNAKTLFLDTFSKNFASNVRVVIFNVRPYHLQVFVPGKPLNLLGTLEFQFDDMADKTLPTLINPKPVIHKNMILMSFKTRDIKLADVHDKITMQALLDSGIPQSYALCLYKIFHPDLQFFSAYMKCNDFPPFYKEALKFVEVFCYMQRLQRKKIEFSAKFSCNGDISPFLKNLPFTLTHAQMTAIKEIQCDLRAEKACRRIVMGDVGCGKTMVILASVMLAYPYKSILMAPTTILAKQLYEEAKKYLPSFVRISYVVATTSKKKRQIPIDGDFIIGTQALLYRDGEFSDFALVMTDEQHRFGTNARIMLEKMLEKKNATSYKKPHNIQFSATPIPRTMAMLKSGIVDFSFIKELPFKKDIDTLLITKKHFPILLEHIKEEIAKGHQVAIVYPRIESAKEDSLELSGETNVKNNAIPYMPLEDAKEYWLKHFDHVFSTHGKDKAKEEVLEQFAGTSGAILLATTMIEVGISLPKLSIIVIVGAERLGLASLHQLRGRVSRNGLKGYCYLYMHDINNQRLKRFSQTLSGFDIADLDLEYRNSGDLLDGVLQSGEQFSYFNFAQDSHLLEKAQAILKTMDTDIKIPMQKL